MFWGGLTYNAHALSRATALAVIEVMEEEGLVANAQKMGAIMREEMDRLTAKHPSLKVGRRSGCLGCWTFKRTAGGSYCLYNGSHPAMQAANAYCREQGMLRSSAGLTSSATHR